MGGEKPASLFSHTIIGFGADFITYLLSFLASIVIARALGPENRGTLALVVSLNLYLMYLFTVGVSASSQIQVAKKEYSLEAIHTFVVLFSITMGVLCLLLYLVFQPWLFETVLKRLDPRFGLIAVFMMPFVLYLNMTNDMIIGMAEIPMLNLIKLIKGILDFLIPVLLLLVIPLGLKGAVSAWVISTVAVVCFQMAWFLNKSGGRFEFNPNIVRSSLGYGWKLYLAFIPWVGIMQIDTFVLNHFRGPRELGFYAVAYAFVFKFTLLFGALINAARARIIGDSEQLAERLVKRLIRHSILFACVMVLVLTAASPFVIRWFYGEAYRQAAGVFRVLSVGVIAMPVANFLNIYAVGQLKKPGICAWVNWGVFGIGLALYLWLVPRYGMMGAAWTTSFISVVRVLAYLWFLGWFSKSSVREILFFEKHDLVFWKGQFQSLYQSMISKTVPNDR